MPHQTKRGPSAWGGDGEGSGGGGAPTDGPYVTTASDGDLSNETLIGAIILPPDLFVNRPSAAGLPAGTLFHSSDTEATYRADGSGNWVDYSDAGGGGAQTPWASNIDAATFDLQNLGEITFDGTPDSTFNVASDPDKWYVPIRDETGAVVGGIGYSAGAPGVVVWLGDDQTPTDFDGPILQLLDTGGVYIQNAAGNGTLTLSPGGGFDLIGFDEVNIGGSDVNLSAAGLVSLFSGTGIDGNDTPATLTALGDTLVDLGVITSYSFTNGDELVVGQRTTPDTSVPGDVGIDVLLSGGIAGGDTLSGGNAASEGLILASTSNATRGTITLRDSTILSGEDRNSTAGTAMVLMSVPSTRTFTLDESAFNAGNAVTAFLYAPTVLLSGDPAINVGSVFSDLSTLKNSNGSTRTTLGIVSFRATPTLQADGGSHLIGYSGFLASPTINRINSGATTNTAITGFQAEANVDTGAVITTRIGVTVANVTGTGSVTTQVGVDVSALTSGTTDIGVRIAKADTYSLQLSDTGGTAPGGITFGTDTNLYRSAANTLLTDDAFTVTGTFTVLNSSAVPTQTALDNSTKIASTAYVDRHGAYAAYVPTFTQSGALTTSSLLARYTQIGKMIHCWGSATFSNTGTTANAVTMTLPVTAHASSAAQVAGTGRVADTGTNVWNALIYLASTTTSQWLDSNQVGSTNPRIGVTPAFAVASGDIATWNFTYEAAEVAGFRAASVVIVPDGQSLNITPTFEDNWPIRVCEELGYPAPIDVHVGGAYYTTRVEYAPLWVQPYASAALNTIYTLCGGTTDLQLNRTGAEVYATMVTLADQARGWGYDTVIATTVTPSSVFSGPQETQRLAANVAILADAEDAFDAVSDFAAAPLNDYSNATYYSDGTHFTPTGAGAAADKMVATLATLDL